MYTKLNEQQIQSTQADVHWTTERQTILSSDYPNRSLSMASPMTKTCKLLRRHHLKYGHDDCSEDRTAKTRMKSRLPTIQCITWTSWMHRHHVGTREENGIWRDRHRHNRSQLTLLRLLIVYDGNGWSGESGDIAISEGDHHHVIAWQSH